jgi:hypothetical protein
MPWFPPEPEEADAVAPPSAADLLDWHPHVQRPADARQLDLLAGLDPSNDPQSAPPG